jgi:probable DNA repair protein
VLEASGLGFDALWVAGLAADRWPSAPGPNPLLPLAWQRQHDVAHATAQREREYAEALTLRFARAAPEVVFSSASMIDDHPSSPSALILDYPEREAPARASAWAESDRSAVLESIIDERAPPLEPGIRAPGGAQIVVKQSDCPFQAVARYRLGARPWALPPDGLTPPERGRLVHAALARFWSAVRDSRTLAVLDERTLSARIGAAVEGALGELPLSRWRALPALLREGEARRLAQLLRAWLRIEQARTPFVVDAVEAPTLLQLAGIEFALKRDRVDTLADGGAAILDYKTGPVERPRQWFEERPRSAQLGMYTLAQLGLEPRRPVRVVGYAELRPEGVAPVGIAADETWPELDGIDAAPGGSWSGLEAWWRNRLQALAQEIRAGHAAVAPRLSPSPCRNCGLQPLCRIESMQTMPLEDANDE